MYDMRISFEHQYIKYHGERIRPWLKYNESEDSYNYPEVQLAFIWYCWGYYAGERG